LGGITAAAGAISNAYLGYQSLEEARKTREMQEKYSAANLFNKGTMANTVVRDTASNNQAVNGWSDAYKDEQVNQNLVRTAVA
jgi:hypothetical protein